METGFIVYSMEWSGSKVHPADAYDGEQGSGYPPPAGARDEYSYRIRGTAEKLTPSFDSLDNRTLKTSFIQHTDAATRELTHHLHSSTKKYFTAAISLILPVILAERLMDYSSPDTALSVIRWIYPTPLMLWIMALPLVLILPAQRHYRI